MFEIDLHPGISARPFLRDLAALRISVFRDFPYLYEGSIDYEMEYLSNYFSSDKSVLITVREGSRIVGASTAAPLSEADGEFQEPIANDRMNIGGIFYFGESVLLPEFRGRGIGHRFFDLREDWAERCGFPVTAFCAVVREPEHPMRPPGYRPLDSFWEGRGYRRRDDLVVKLPWKEVGPTDSGDTSHDLAYWLRGERA